MNKKIYDCLINKIPNVERFFYEDYENKMFNPIEPEVVFLTYYFDKKIKSIQGELLQFLNELSLSTSISVEDLSNYLFNVFDELNYENLYNQLIKENKVYFTSIIQEKMIEFENVITPSKVEILFKANLKDFNSLHTDPINSLNYLLSIFQVSLYKAYATNDFDTINNSIEVTKEIFLNCTEEVKEAFKEGLGYGEGGFGDIFLQEVLGPSSNLN
ncbi:MAG: hypothetical protein J7604_10325 [Sporocytophaga sp.]|uniref:hypothetical protein n=1 Tax=Sporocytophaga sp. TaxID=2231183 RepID=UPI001B01C554|nr:hypothetical protein [Sporocytophaga sp.]MBO9700594.1 hypothetical protein [Sporocytophaga sp.]